MHGVSPVASLAALFSASAWNNGFSCPNSLNLLWVIWPLTSLLSLSDWHSAKHGIKCRTFFSPLFCVLPYWCPQTGKGHPAKRPFSMGTKPNLSKSASVWYTSVLAGYFIRAQAGLWKRVLVSCPLHRKQPFNLLHIWFKSKEISSRASDRSAFFVWWCNRDPHGPTLVHMHKYINFKQTEQMKSAHYPSFTLLYENIANVGTPVDHRKGKGRNIDYLLHTV